MSIRTATVERKTAETSVKLILNLDGNGHGVIDSGIGFFDHMLNLMTDVYKRQPQLLSSCPRQSPSCHLRRAR